MPVLHRRGSGRREFSDDTLKSIQTFVIRRTSGMVSGGFRTDIRRNLDEDEQAELVALTREAEKGGGFVFDRLSKKKQDRWERLVGKGGGDEKFFANQREQAQLAEIAREASRATTRRPFRRSEEAGLLRELGEQLAGGFITADMIAPLVVVLISLERGEGLGPQTRVERDTDGEPVLIVSRSYGLVSERRDWRASMAAWPQALTHLAKNSWIKVDGSAGNEFRITLGSRAKRAMRGEKAKPKRAAA